MTTSLLCLREDGTDRFQFARDNFKTFARFEERLPKRFLYTYIERNEFKEHATLDRKDFAAIEYLLRKGQRQLENYSDPGIKNIRR